MDYPKIRNMLDSFYPRFKIVIDKLGRHEEDYLEAIIICKKALAKKYIIIFDPYNKEVQIGEKLRDR